MRLEDLTPEQMQGAAALAGIVFCENLSPKKQEVVWTLQQQRPETLVKLFLEDYCYSALERNVEALEELNGLVEKTQKTVENSTQC